MYKTFKNYLNKRKTINELNSLSDMELTDIGIKRNEITKIVNGLMKT